MLKLLLKSALVKIVTNTCLCSSSHINLPPLVILPQNILNIVGDRAKPPRLLENCYSLFIPNIFETIAK